MRQLSGENGLISKFEHGGARVNAGGARAGAGRRPAWVAEPLTALERRWYCVRTGYGAEVAADTSLRLAGFTVFAPSLWKPAIAARRDRNGVLRPARPDRVVPLFPRYLFVQFCRSDLGWRRIRGMTGVDYVFSASAGSASDPAGVPVAVPDAAIAQIRGLCSGNDCVYPTGFSLVEGRVVSVVPPGTPVRLIAGPMADLSGFCEMSNGKRVRVLLNLMGRAVSVTLSQSAIEVDDDIRSMTI